MSGSHGLAKTYEQYVGDFETTTIASDCRVWLWAVADVRTLDVSFGLDIRSFCKFIADRQSYVWFHNLAFDGSFLIDHLLRNGYIHVDDNPIQGQFSTLISNMGKFYSIKVKWQNGKVTEFRDSLKKLPMAVSQIAGAFKLEEVKGSIDYHLTRPVGYEPTPEEYEYITNDVVIVAKAVRNQLSLGLTRLTVGSDALAEYKSMIGKGVFDALYPILPLELDSEIRRAYRGGFTYADPRFSKRRVGKGSVYDVNGLYPYVMYSQLLPVGEPYCTTGVPEDLPGYPLWIANLTITARLKAGHIPCIQIKGNPGFSATEYQTKISEPVSVACTNIDFDLWQKHYDIGVHDYNGVFYFRGQTGLFKTYIDKWSTIKAEATGGIRAIAKLQLTSLYGKFGTNPNVTPKIPIMGDEDFVRLVIGEEQTREPVYTAMAVFVTAYARSITITAAQEHYDNFAYADTDSLHLIGDSSANLYVHPTELGAWKHEYDFTSAYYLRAKGYTEFKKQHHTSNAVNEFWVSELETHIAGLPVPVAKKVRYHHYETANTELSGKLTPHRVPGGVVLVDTKFNLTKKRKGMLF